jgi:hypothetical protein
MNFLDKFRYRYDNLKELNTNNPKVKKSINFNNPILKSLLSTSVKVTPEIFPKIDHSIKTVFEKLQLENNFNFFVTANHNQTQASCAMMPESDSAEIIITSRMIELLNEKELQYVLGHEISHHYYQHNIYPSPNQAKSKIELLKLLHLSRASEISADRAGFLGSGNIEHSLKAMLKITSGLGEDHLTFNFSSYLDQLRELKQIKGDQNQMYSTHPSFLNRMQALVWFSMSHEYHEYFETNKKGIYDLKTVDQKINESIKKVTGRELDISTKEIFSNALMWCSLKIFIADSKFTKKEQELFKKNFGEKSTISILSLLKISNPKSIDSKINNALAEASNLLIDEREKLLSELSKLVNVAEGDKKLIKDTLDYIKKNLKI